LGTIMDGIYYVPPKQYNNDSQKTTNSRPIFYIDDVLYLRGDNVCNTKILNKNINLTSYLERCYIDDDVVSTVVLKINSIYELDKLSELANFIKDKNNIKGITFYPELAGTKLIYIEKRDSNFNQNYLQNQIKNSNNTNINYIKNNNDSSFNFSSNEDNDEKSTIINNNDNANREDNIECQGQKDEIKVNWDESEKESQGDNKLNSVDTNVFSMKYVSPDVYKLYINKNDNIEEVGIALIPTFDSSKYWNSVFKKNTELNIQVTCKYDNHKKKWIPVSKICDNTCDISSNLCVISTNL